jgi:hypothetical protein
VSRNAFDEVCHLIQAPALVDELWPFIIGIRCVTVRGMVDTLEREEPGGVLAQFYHELVGVEGYATCSLIEVFDRYSAPALAKLLVELVQFCRAVIDPDDIPVGGVLLPYRDLAGWGDNFLKPVPVPAEA